MMELLYGAYVYKFILELLVCCMIFVILLPHRKYFVIRIIATAACCLLLSRVWNWDMAQSISYSIIRYTVLFGAVFLSIWICFDCSVWSALFCVMGGYATQHLFYKSYQILNLFTGKMPIIWMVVGYLVLLAVILWMVERLLKKFVYPNNYRSIENRKNLFLCGIILLCTVVFSIIYSYYSSLAPRPLLIVCSLYDCVCCMFALYIQCGMFQMDYMKQEMAVIQQLWYQDKKQMEISRETIDLINIKCHDMKHTIHRMTKVTELADERELKNIQDLISLYDVSVNTDNRVLNLVLAEKSIVCQKSGIQMSCIADGEKLNFMEEADIYSLFQNAIENAISAVQELEDEEKRVISLMIKPALGFLSICIENYYQGELKFQDGLPVTDKKDKDYHGYGIKSMRYLVQKYHGDLTIKAENGIFTLSILFPLEQE